MLNSFLKLRDTVYSTKLPEFINKYNKYRFYQANWFYNLELDQVSFDNFIIGFQHVAGKAAGINPLFRDGSAAEMFWSESSLVHGI